MPGEWLSFIGAVVSLCGGLYLFSADEDKRRRQRDIVRIEAAGEHHCARCLRPATLGRWVGTRWIYGAEEACLFDHCQSLGATLTATLFAREAIMRGDDIALAPINEDDELRRRLIRKLATPRLLPPDLLTGPPGRHMRKLPL